MPSLASAPVSAVISPSGSSLDAIQLHYSVAYYVLNYAGLFIAAILFYNFYWKRRKLPPGPAPLPLVGNLWDIYKSGSGEDTFIQWRKEYGDVYTYWMGEMPIVAVNDYKKIIETFQKDGDAYAGRTWLHEWSEYLGGHQTTGVIRTEGELWREQRRFALHVLKNFGMGKNLMQERVLDEVSFLLNKVHGDLEKCVEEHDLPALIDITVGSIINAVLFGYRFSGSEEGKREFAELKHRTIRFVKDYGHPLFRIVMTKINFLSRLPVLKKQAEKVRSSWRHLLAFYQRQIDKHLAEIDLETDAPPTDFSEAFLREKHRRDVEGEEHNYSMPQLLGMCNDLFLAGQETTSTTLQWGLAYLVHAQDAQSKLHKELDRVIGSDRLVTNADRHKLPYTSAVVHEIGRLCNLFPQNVMHKTTRDVVIDGYFLPKDTCILPQISTVLYDEDIFPEPKRFNPDRFIDENGGLKRADEVIPYSVGKRQCLGESLARMELFLFVANIFNQFKITSGASPPSLQRTFGGTVHCPAFTCRVEKRH